MVRDAGANLGRHFASVCRDQLIKHRLDKEVGTQFALRRVFGLPD